MEQHKHLNINTRNLFYWGWVGGENYELVCLHFGINRLTEVAYSWETEVALLFNRQFVPYTVDL